MQKSYWSRVLNTRISRRRTIVGTSALAGSAAFLAACGDDDNGGSSPSTGGTTGTTGSTGATGSTGGTGGTTGSTGSSGILTIPEDTISQARRGGTMADRTTQDVSSMDVHSPIAPLNFPARHVYSTLVRLRAPYLQEETTFELEPDFADSWEVAPDGLTITMHLRDNVKWHNKPPVNGRNADAEDVVASWKRYSEAAPLRALAANSVNPQAPVISVEATDASTIAIKLTEPVVYALNLFASFGSFTGNIVMVPKEALDPESFDIRREMIGTGPYWLSKYEPSVAFELSRNEEYWDDKANYPEKITLPMVSEYTQLLAQLKAGNILHSETQLRSNDLMTILRDEPRLQAYAIDLQTASSVLTFGWQGDPSPFADVRVRQAWSMAYDRDAWIDAMFEVSALESEGLDIETRWNSALPAEFGAPSGWLDPLSNDFGPNAKYYQHNIEEARALMSAAGFPDGVDVTSNRITSGAVPLLATHSEALEGMVQDAGFRISVRDIDYATEYIPLVRDANGQFEGVGWHTVTGTTPWRMAPESALAAEYWSKGGVTFKGFSTSGQNDKSGDPDVDRMIERMRVEQDAEERKSIMHDLQRDLAAKLYGLINPGAGNTFAVAWPAVRSYQVYRTRYAAAYTHYGVWLDDTKAPFA